MKIPEHVAIIMDGNGRWAKSKGMPRNYGHTMGAKNVEEMCYVCKRLGIKYLTLYAFSTENWSRPEAEVSALMKLMGNYLDTCEKRCHANKMRLRVIGDVSKLESRFREQIKHVEEVSSVYDELNLIIAINYGSRDEIVRAIKEETRDVLAGKLSVDEIDEKVFSSYLDTKDVPDPDLMIRTSGEQRLSNYLLWQLAYTEFYFTDKAWPEFDEDEMKKAIEAYNNRDRRYGGVKE